MTALPSAAPRTVHEPAPANARWVTMLCWLAIMLDGFDAVVLGAVMPTLLADADFGLTKATGTTVATIGLVGMMIGALTMGRLTDRIGRRAVLMLAVSVFSLFTAACALAPDPTWLGILRFLAGVGLGGALPTAIAMVNEFTPPQRRGNATTVLMTGYHVGAVATAALGLVLLGPIGWRGMFVVGALPALVLVPLMWRRLPESGDYVAARDAQARVGMAEVLTPQFVRNSVAIWVTSFMGLLLVYGLNTWLPQIMRESGYALGAALQLLLVLNAGAVAGLLISGRVADAITPRTAAIVWFAGSAVFLALLVLRLPMAALYVLVFVTGAFVFSSQVLVYASTSASHPAHLRATAIGLSAGIGRTGAIAGPLLGGLLISSGHVHPWGFYAFAAVGVLGALGMLLTRNLAASR